MLVVVGVPNKSGDLKGVGFSSGAGTTVSGRNLCVYLTVPPIKEYILPSR